jgi:hypothetical protein
MRTAGALIAFLLLLSSCHQDGLSSASGLWSVEVGTRLVRHRARVRAHTCARAHSSTLD